MILMAVWHNENKACYKLWKKVLELYFILLVASAAGVLNATDKFLRSIDKK